MTRILRWPLILAVTIIALHICEALTLGTSAFGSFLANNLQIIACGFASAMAFGAFRRGRGLERPFWLIVAIGIAMWGVANLGWMYYEVWLRREPPTTSVVRFLFGLENALFAMTLLLDQNKESPRIDAEAALDFTQIAIVFFFIFVEYYYVPAHRLEGYSLFLQKMRVENAEDVLITGLSAFYALRARKPHIRKLYGGLALFMLLLTLCAGLAQYLQVVKPAPTGTFRDLLWTLPFLAGALWAAQWQPGRIVESNPPLRRRALSELILSNVTFALAPLIILWQISRLGTEWHVLRFSLLGLSIVCFAARLGISLYREAKSSNAVLTRTLAMDSAVNGMAILDAESKYLYVNPAYAQMVGSSDPESLLGKLWEECCDSRDLAPVRDEIRNSLNKQGKWFGPITFHHPDGKVVPMDLAITSLPDGGIICVTRDLSPQISAQRARAEAETRYRMLVEQVAAISYIAELGVTGRWLYVSPQIETILGYSPEEWLAGSTSWIRHILPEDRHIIEAAEETSSRGEPFQAEYRITHKDGRILWVSDNAVVVRASNDHPIMEGLIVDITERKQLENQLQQSRRMEAVGRLAGGIAHDFNNLLTIIRGYAEMAMNRPGNSAELASDIQQIGNAADRASMLIRQLLAFSRKQVLRPKPLDLNAIVEGLEKLFGRLLGAHIQMATVYGENLGTVKADPSQIEQVIMNLVVNARDAMPNGGRLTIETSNVDVHTEYTRDQVSVKRGQYIMLAVSDTGIGMDPGTLAHIFEPFYSTKDGGHGTGLGLSTVYGIVKQSDGYIWVSSEPGKGTTFQIYLPRVEEVVMPASPVNEKPVNRRGTETVLLVEDEEAVRELTRDILAEDGYCVLVAKDTNHAEQLAANGSNEIHLLLTDVVMPGLSGRELARRVTLRNPKTRVLFMSGYTDNLVVRGGVLETGVAFLQKPFTPRDLKQKVREVLDSIISVS